MNTSNHEFLGIARQIVLSHIDNPNFCATSFSQAIYLSRSQLHRRLKTLTGKSTTEFIRTVKMKKAANLLTNNNSTIYRVAYAVGFTNLSYFTKCFKAEFGVLPSEYQKKL